MTVEGQQAAYGAAAQTITAPYAQAAAPSPARQGQGAGEPGPDGHPAAAYPSAAGPAGYPGADYGSAGPTGYPGAAYPNAAGSAGYPGASYPGVVTGAAGRAAYPAAYAPASASGEQSAADDQEQQPGQGAMTTWQANLARLEGLAEVLAHRGLRARLITPPGRVPSLHVVNPSASALAEDVYAGRGQDGRWWFWWSWAERIAVDEDLDGAAALIEHVLAAS